MNAIQICNLFLAVNLFLLLLSTLYLWLPSTFKIFSWVWFIYSFSVTTCLLVRKMSKYPGVRMAFIMADLDIDRLSTLIPSLHVRFDKISKEYKRVRIIFLFITTIILIIQYKYYVSGI